MLRNKANKLKKRNIVPGHTQKTKTKQTNKKISKLCPSEITVDVGFRSGFLFQLKG